jgi:hypothetical protein
MTDLTPPSTPPSTPAARWRDDGQPDPHGHRYDGERARTIMGHLSDDELANAVYLCNHRTSLDSMGLLAAAKDRIRWLSRALVRATAGVEASLVPLAAEWRRATLNHASDRASAEVWARNEGREEAYRDAADDLDGVLRSLPGPTSEELRMAVLLELAAAYDRHALDLPPLSQETLEDMTAAALAVFFPPALKD